MYYVAEALTVITALSIVLGEGEGVRPVVEVADGVEVAVEPPHVVGHDALGQDAKVLGVRAEKLLDAAAHARQQVLLGALHDAVEERPVHLRVGALEEGVRRPVRDDGEPEAGLLEELLQVGGHVEGGRLEVLRDEALQRRRVGRENGQGEDPPRARHEAGGKGLKLTLIKSIP